MNVTIKNNRFLKVSEIKPEELRSFMLNEVGERAQDKLYNYLKDLSESYPQFENWFYDTVIPEVELKKGEREIIIVLSEIEGSRKSILTGIAILKNNKKEKKICTFRIHENFRKQGIGSALFEECFDYLGTRKPIITISHNRKEIFEHHINNYGFQETQILKGYYKEDSTEYVYNGLLDGNK
ncbi:GNAT family N-acetyltransferase [Paenibacillus alvei]|uniref:GNAT family N-acetyltransferase n=1 Tax=Paenibacillus alvei TaxID=44250 RepID=UPI00228303BE|nr:GNAT family N-acetyltransferase [Paenibacillus alvei]